MQNLTGSTSAVFYLQLTEPAKVEVIANWKTRNGTAQAGIHYEESQGVVRFQPGETEKEIRVLVYGQEQVTAENLNFYIDVDPPRNAVLGTPIIEAQIIVGDVHGVPVASVMVAQGKRGLRGPAGQSAYELAVNTGQFIGTIEQWLEEQGNAAAAAARAEQAKQAAEQAKQTAQQAADNANNAAGTAVENLLNDGVPAQAVVVGDSTLDVFAEQQKAIDGHRLTKWGDSAEAIQSAIDELSNIGYITGQAQELIFEPNKIYRAHLIKLKPFVDLNLNGSTIKKTDYTEADENVPKWWRILVPDFAAFNDVRSKSHRIVIKNGKLDGNYLGTNWTWNTYNQEQASLIYLSTQNQYMTDKNDRCKFLIENMKLNENCSDGLHIGINVDVLIRNIEAFDCFRGGLTITGGNSIIAGAGFDGISARIDTEVDASGFDDTWETDVILDNVYIDRNGKKGNFLGGGDLGTSYGGNCFLTNIHLMTAPVTIRTNEKTNLKIKTATLAVNADTRSANNSYMRSCNDELEDITFVLTEDNAFFRVIPTSAVATDVLEKTVATLKKIKFKKINESIIAPQSCIKLESQRTSSLNYLNFDNLDTSAVDSTYAVELAAGGKVKVNKLKHNSLQAIRATFLTTSKLDLTIGSVESGQRTTGLLSTTVSDTSDVENEIHFTKDCILKSNELQIIGTGNAKFPIFTTYRTILGDAPPSSNLNVYQGDTYRLNKPALGKPYEWVSATTGKTANLWKATKWLTSSFETASLPVLTSFDIGVENFDTTLNKFVKWNGSAWV